MADGVPSFALVTLAAAMTGCAPRTVPTAFPATSAASLRATEAKPAAVTTSLDADPPLPGENASGWDGLTDANRPSDDATHHHHHHHAHGAPTPP